MLPPNWQEEIAILEAKLKAEMDNQPPVTDIDDADIKPRQLRLFDD